MASKSYEEYLNSVKLTPMSRFKLPIPDHEESLGELVAEGFRLLEAEQKKVPPVPTSKVPPKGDAKKLENALAAMSDNPYVRARTQILNKMTPEARAVIEKMEKGTLEKDHRYDKFAKAVADLGDKLSSSN